MVLYGKIIAIEYAGELNWWLTIDSHRKKFPTHQALLSYLVRVLQEGKDETKLALLREDMKNLIQRCKNELLEVENRGRKV